MLSANLCAIIFRLKTNRANASGFSGQATYFGRIHTIRRPESGAGDFIDKARKRRRSHRVASIIYHIHAPWKLMALREGCTRLAGNVADARKSEAATLGDYFTRHSQESNRLRARSAA